MDYYLSEEPSTPRSSAILQKAKQEFATAITLNPSDDKSQYNLILTSLEQSFSFSNPQRIVRYEALVRTTRRFPSWRTSSHPPLRSLAAACTALLAEAYQTQRRYKDAIPAYLASLQMLGDDSSLRDLRAHLLNNIGQAYERTAEQYWKPEERDLATGQRRLAVNCYRKAATFSPNYARAYLNLGSVLIDLKEYAAAEKAYAEALQRRPEYANAYYDFGLLYERMAEDGALAQLNAAGQNCLKAQARAALRNYIGILEVDQADRDLSASEQAALQYARSWLREIEARNPAMGDAFHEYGHCLEGLPSK